MQTMGGGLLILLISVTKNSEEVWDVEMMQNNEPLNFHKTVFQFSRRTNKEFLKSSLTCTMFHISNLFVSLQRRNAWLRAFRTCSNLMICHHLRLWTCLLACPASSKTPVTCRRPCWMIFECARVTPSSVISCWGAILTSQDMLRQHRLLKVPTSAFVCFQIGAGQRGWIKRCTEGPC